MAGISPVVVHITYGIRSSPECDTTCEKIRDAVKEVVQHAEVSWERSEDYAMTDTFKVYVNGQKIYKGNRPKINDIVKKAKQESGGDTFKGSEESSRSCIVQ